MEHEKTNKSKIRLRKAGRFIVLIVAALILYYAVGFLFWRTASINHGESYDAIRSYDYITALSKLKTLETISKPAAFFLVFDTSYIKSDLSNIAFVEALANNENGKIADEVARSLLSAEKPQDILKRLDSIIYNTAQYNRSLNDVPLPEIVRYLAVYKEAIDELNKQAGTDVIKFTSNEMKWRYSLPDKNFPSGISTNPTGKVLVIYRNNNNILEYDNGICFDLTLMLPKQYIPNSLEEVEYIILIENDLKPCGLYNTSNNSTAIGAITGYQQYSQVSLIRADDASIIKNYGAVEGEIPLMIIDENKYGNDPDYATKMVEIAIDLQKSIP